MQYNNIIINNMKTVSITMDASLLGEIDRWIKRADVGGRSEVIRQAVREWLRRRTLEQQIEKEIEGYRKRPVKPGEFAPLLNAQEIPE